MEDVNWMAKEHTGMWTVLGPTITTPKGEMKYLCRCDCGTERYVLERSLRYGGSKSCGCLTRKMATEAVEHKLEGQVFGNFTVMGKAAKKERNGGTWWVCRCSCGNTLEVSGTLLVTGRKSHCGCGSNPQYYYVDITDKPFAHLTAKYVAKRDKGVVYWHCVCECGNEVDIPYNELVYSHRKSCGCKKNAHEQNLARLLTHVDGTSVDMIRSKKLPADNTTGAKGVYFIKGKYVAKIVFQRKAYYLGAYSEFEKAVRARREAEELLFDGAVSHYNKWKLKAEADPEWGENNPVSILVAKKSSNQLEVTFLPVI